VEITTVSPVQRPFLAGIARHCRGRALRSSQITGASSTLALSWINKQVGVRVTQRIFDHEVFDIEIYGLVESRGG
jgi:hypothetical protein